MDGAGGGWNRRRGFVLAVVDFLGEAAALRRVRDTGVLARGSLDTVPCLCRALPPPPACSDLGEGLPLEVDRRGFAVVFIAEGSFGFLGLELALGGMQQKLEAKEV